MIICFDTDECLINRNTTAGEPIPSNIELLKILSKTHKIIVWSGRGWENALRAVQELKLHGYISGVADKYGNFRPDIAFDDQEIDLGRLNIKI